MTLVMINEAQIKADFIRKIARLEKQQSTTPHKIARLIQLRSRLLAPKDTGKLRNSIKVKARKKGYSVRVTAGMNSFPYPKWVNQDAGFQNLQYHVPNLKYRIPVGAVLTYGSSPLTWNWTGTPGFFTIAVNQTLKEAKSIIIKDYNKALGVSITG